ncbi:MAG: alpha/beta hydrolase [Chloroflexota bacterium]|nr:alpha/beta hydrolase [Chloroflexota bacterium]
MRADQGLLGTGDEPRLYYHIKGDGSDVVVMPAASWVDADFDDLLNGRTFIFYDGRGRGGSDPVTDPSQVQPGYEEQDLERVRAHFGLQRFSLIGWSSNGGTVAVYATQHPQYVERLVLMCPVAPYGEAGFRYRNPPESQEKADSRMDPSAVQGLEELRTAGMPDTDPARYCRESLKVYLPRQMGNPTALAGMKSDPCRFPNEWTPSVISFIRHHPLPEAWDWRPQLANLRVPTLVVHGMEDLVLLETSQQWTAALPEARLLTIEGSGHYSHLEAPEVFFPALDSFLRGEWPQAVQPVKQAEQN